MAAAASTPSLCSNVIKIWLLLLITYGICRAPWPRWQLAPARWDRSCSICPWVCLRRRWSLRPAAAVEAGPELRAAPCSGRTATTCPQRRKRGPSVRGWRQRQGQTGGGGCGCCCFTDVPALPPHVCHTELICACPPEGARLL